MTSSPDTPEIVIEAQGLTREYDGVRAVDGLDLRIRRGELFGLVGPDGAGKTTTLRLFAGLLNLSGGSATVYGHDLAREAETIKPQIGYMAQRFSLYGELTVLENLRFFAELYDVARAEREARTRELLDFAGLSPFTKRRAAHLSGGMKKKLALACTLIHQPPVLLLDEPTTGVDPVSRREFWEILTDLYREGTTIIVTTPYMDEADRCGRVGLLYEGRLMECATPKEIRSKIEGELIELQADDWQAARDLSDEIPGLIELQTYGESLHLLVDSAERRVPQIRQLLDDHGLKIHALRPARLRMEEAFISLVRRLETQEAGDNG